MKIRISKRLAGLLSIGMLFIAASDSLGRGKSTCPQASQSVGTCKPTGAGESSLGKILPWLPRRLAFLNLSSPERDFIMIVVLPCRLIFNGKPSASAGIIRIEVIAVTDTKVLTRTSSYLQRPDTGTLFSGSSSSVISANGHQKQVLAIWIDTKALEAFQSDANTQVVSGPFPHNGQTYDAKTITHIMK